MPQWLERLTTNNHLCHRNSFGKILPMVASMIWYCAPLLVHRLFFLFFLPVCVGSGIGVVAIGKKLFTGPLSVTVAVTICSLDLHILLCLVTICISICRPGSGSYFSDFTCDVRIRRRHGHKMEATYYPLCLRHESYSNLPLVLAPNWDIMM